MALTVLNRQGLPELFGQSLGQGLGGIGQGFGQGLSSGINMLTQVKMNELVRRQQRQEKAKGVKALGLPEAYADLSDNLLALVLKNKLEEPQRQTNALLTSAFLGEELGGEQKQNLQQVLQQAAPQQQMQLGQQFQPQSQESMQPVQVPQFNVPEIPMSLEQRVFGDILKKIPKELTPQTIEQAEVQTPEEAAITQPKMEVEQMTKSLASRPKADAQRLLREAVKNGQLSNKDADKWLKVAMDQRKINQKADHFEREFARKLGKEERAEAERAESREYERIKESYKEAKPERMKIIEEKRAADRDLRDLERIEELEKEGKLDTPGYIEFLKRSGLDIPALMKEGSEEFNKIVTNFLRDAKIYYGGRVTNQEMEQFLKILPSLSQSPEGRKRVIANLKYLNRAKVAYYDAYREVLKENKNKPLPPDWQEQIDDKIGKRLDKLSAKFKQDLLKKVPTGQNRLITAAQTIGGKALGNVPKALGTGTAGALTGLKFGGVPGAIGGGLAGALAGLGGFSLRDLIP